MSDLARVLQLWHDASGRLGTVRGTVTSWNNGGVREASWRQHRAWLEAKGSSGPPPDEDWDDIQHQRSRRFVAQWPDRFRIEADEPQPDPPYRYTLLKVDGGDWLAMFGPDLAQASAGDPLASKPSLHPLDGMLDPAHVIGGVTITEVSPPTPHGTQQLVGVARHTGRQLSRPDPGLFSWGADRYEIVIDAELGILLDVTSILDDRPINRVTLSDVEHGGGVAPDAFDPTPPPDVQVLPAPRIGEKRQLPRSRTADRDA